MPDLFQSLQGRDLGHLRIVAGLWGLEFSAPDARVGLQRLAPLLLDAPLVQEVVELLPEQARSALDDLLRSEGRLPWPVFTRRYGAVREMGPARRDRERPYAIDSSPAEMLWYRALAGRAFFDTPAGPQEFAFIPDDLLPLIPQPEVSGPQPLGRPASPAERSVALPANDRVLDHACTLLAALRLGLPLDDPAVAWEEEAAAAPAAALTPAVLQALLAAAGLLDPSGIPLPEPTRTFLEAPRSEAVARLVTAWLRSPDFNELHLLPGLSPEGDWRNDPLGSRQAVLEFLMTVPGSPTLPAREAGPERPYWSLAAFVAAIRQQHPDFQRPAGDYDSWYLREEASGEFLRGFEHWDAVDGALIRYIICGPLHWLGVLDLAAPAADPGGGAVGPAAAPQPAAFRFSAWGAALLAGAAPDGLPVEDEPLHAGSDARVHAPRLAPRPARYQLARFCLWEGETATGYHYRITPSSLQRARQQGLRGGQLLTLLRRWAPGVPPVLARALERWDEHGSEARLERVTILRLSSPELLQALRSSRGARFLGDPLGPTTVIVRPGAWQKVMSVLAEMGYLTELIEEEAGD